MRSASTDPAAPIFHRAAPLGVRIRRMNPSTHPAARQR